MTKPSRFIINSDYATLKNDDEGELSITLPDSFTVTTTPQTFRATATIGEKSAGMRWRVASSKYPGVNLLTPNFRIPCKVTITYQGQSTTIDSYMYGSIYRSGPRIVEMIIIPNYSAGVDSFRVFDIAQTITAKLQTFITPFEA